MPSSKSNFDWRDLSKSARQSVYAALKETIPLVVDDAKSNVPVKTGDLKNSIKGGVKEKTDNVFGWVKAVDLKYAQSVEYGHGSYPPHPFLRPAFDKYRETIVEKFKV